MFTIKKRTKLVRDDIKRKLNDRYWQFIKDNPDKPWDWEVISRNPIITIKFIIDNPDKPGS